MPTPSALDRIAASLHDLAAAIKHPAPGSPLSPLDTCQVAALDNLIQLFTASMPTDTTATTNDAATEPTADSHTPPTVDGDTHVPEPTADNNNLAASHAQPTDDPLVPVTTITPPADDAVSTDKPISNDSLLPADAPRLRVTSNSGGDTTPVLTYRDATKRKSRTKPAGSAPTPSTTTATFAQIATPSAAAPATPTGCRRSNRKRRKPLKHRATPGSAANVMVVPPEESWYDEHWALHGTAMNPDTGQIAEYDELSRSSDGPQWIQSNTEEFGRLAQGLGPDSSISTGTNTIYFIHPREMPADRIATYLRIVCAD